MAITYDAFGLNSVPMIIPAQETSKVVLNYTKSLEGIDPDVNPNPNQNLGVAKSDQLKIEILTPAGNFFSIRDLSPSPIVQVKTQKEDYSITSRDIIVLDGTGTEFSPDNFAKVYVWRMDIPQTKWNGNWNTGNTTTKYLRGALAEYRPESLFNATELNSTSSITGPFRISLKVVDEKGLVSRSETVIVAIDPSIAPIGSISLANATLDPTGTETPVILQVRDFWASGERYSCELFNIRRGFGWL